jgi:hypothetical protein
MEPADWSVGRCGTVGHSVEVKMCPLLKYGGFIAVKVHFVVFCFITPYIELGGYSCVGF